MIWYIFWELLPATVMKQCLSKCEGLCGIQKKHTHKSPTGMVSVPLHPIAVFRGFNVCLLLKMLKKASHNVFFHLITALLVKIDNF